MLMQCFFENAVNMSTPYSSRMPSFSKIKKIRLKATATREAKTIPLNSISPNFMLRPLNPVVNTIEVRIKFFDFE